MLTRFIEATNIDHGGINWGKFLVAKFDSADWNVHAVEADGLLLEVLPGKESWNRDTSVIVFDLQTGEGARFDLRTEPAMQLDKHRVWVCPMFAPFLDWLFKEIQSRPPGLGRFDITTLPAVAKFAAPSALAGHRRQGPTVHILVHGRALCGFEADRVPGQWTPGHLWVDQYDTQSPTCADCKTALANRQD